MQRKILMVLAVGLLVAADAPKGDEAAKEVEKSLRTLGEAFMKRDVDAIKRLMTDDHVAILAYGHRESKADQLKSLPDLTLTDYSMSEVKVVMVSNDVALISYKLSMIGSFKGKELPRENYVAAVWVKRGGTWVEASYQETPLRGK